MNQILKPELNMSNKTPSSNYFQEKDKRNIEKKNQNLKKEHLLRQNRFYLLQFILSSFVATCFLIALFIRMISLQEKEALSEELTKTYQISTLYSNNEDYSAKHIQSEDSNNVTSSTPFVIGLIKIDKINLNYPILSESNKEFLNISVCRFAGPMPNEKGNLCIARAQLC